MIFFEKFDEISSIILQDIKETKRYGHTFVRSDNVKTVYPPTNTVWGGGGGGGGIKNGNNVFSIITLWELSFAMETRVLIRSGPKPNAAFPS